MRIENMLQTPAVAPQNEPQTLNIIDEKQIKSILFLGLKGDVKIEPESDHAVDKFA
jgi:hypothetical protein